MANVVEPTHESLLRLCAAEAPKPWFPRIYAKTSSVSRDSLDSPLNDLRLAGLIQLTDWEPETGQGYILTDLGKEVLSNPVMMDQVRAGLEPPMVEAAEETATPPREGLNVYERGESARSAFFYPEPPRVVSVILALNIIAFLVSAGVAIRMGKPLGEFLVQGHPEVLHSVGALEAQDLVYSQWWRLLTCAFLHFGLIHLGVNMYSVFALARMKSPWDNFRFTLIYLFSALGGSCAAMIYSPGTPTERVVLAGASGAIWGLMTSIPAWLLLVRKHLPQHEVAAWFRDFGPLFLVNVGISFLPNISASAHFGGGIVGFVLGTLLHIHRWSVPPRKTAITIMILMLPFICMLALLEVMQKDSRWQRITEAHREKERQSARQVFKQDVVPRVNQAVTAYEKLEPQIGNVTDPDRKVDPPEEFLQEIKTLTETCTETMRLFEKDFQLTERETAVRDAAKEYVAAWLDVLKLIPEWTNLERPMAKETASARRSALRRLDKARDDWKAQRQRL